MSAIGTLVHYVPPDGAEAVHGHCRPALLVTEAHGDTAALVVFRDPDLDGTVGSVQAVGTRPHSPNHEFGTWHYPAECRAASPGPGTPDGPAAASSAAAE